LSTQWCIDELRTESVGPPIADSNMLTESRDNEHTESPMLVPETPEENYEDAFESESKSGESEGRAVATQQENSNEVANNTDYAC